MSAMGRKQTLGITAYDVGVTLKRVPRWLWLTAGVFAICGGAIALLQDPAHAERCERLMVAYESNTADKQALARLNVGCPGWESMR